jgi:hypothetical protein
LKRLKAIRKRETFRELSIFAVAGIDDGGYNGVSSLALAVIPAAALSDGT